MPTTIEYKLDWKDVVYRMQDTEEVNYTFTDQEIDRETGLMYYNARYYNPSLGRFLQEDPVYNGNPYIYVSNNPLKYTDPDGKRRRKVNAERQNLMRQWRKTNARIAARNQFRAGLFKDFQRYVNFGQFSAAEVKYMTSTVNTQIDRLNQRDLDMMYRREARYRKKRTKLVVDDILDEFVFQTVADLKKKKALEKILTAELNNNAGSNSMYASFVEEVMKGQSKVLTHDVGVTDITDDFMKRLINAGTEMTEYSSFWNDLSGELINNDTMRLLLKYKFENVEVSEVDLLSEGVLKELVSDPFKFYHFYRNVKGGGDWNYKSNIYKDYKNKGILILGEYFNYDVPGNVSYGYAGAAAGFSTETLKSLAGLAQKNAGTSREEWTWERSYFDDPRDQRAIQIGIDLYNKYGLDIDKEKLNEFL